MNLEIESRRYTTLHILHLSDGSYALLDQSRTLIDYAKTPDQLAQLVDRAQPLYLVWATKLKLEAEILRQRGRADGLLSHQAPKPVSQITLEDLGL